MRRHRRQLVIIRRAHRQRSDVRLHHLVVPAARRLVEDARVREGVQRDPDLERLLLRRHAHDFSHQALQELFLASWRRRQKQRKRLREGRDCLTPYGRTLAVFRHGEPERTAPFISR